MKRHLPAILTALVALGFAGAASAQCASYAKPVDQSAQAPTSVVPPQGAAAAS